MDMFCVESPCIHKTGRQGRQQWKTMLNANNGMQLTIWWCTVERAKWI